MVDIALWYDTKGAGGSVRGRPSALRFGAAKREPSAGLPAQPRQTRGGPMSFWGERRSARCHTQAVCAWSTCPVRSRASIRSSRESRPGSPRAGPMLRRVTRPCLGITTMLCRRSGFGSVPQCSHATRARSVPTNGASTSTERTATPALSPHDAEKMSRTSAAPTRRRGSVSLSRTRRSTFHESAASPTEAGAQALEQGHSLPRASRRWGTRRQGRPAACPSPKVHEDR